MSKTEKNGYDSVVNLTEDLCKYYVRRENCKTQLYLFDNGHYSKEFYEKKNEAKEW